MVIHVLSFFQLAHQQAAAVAAVHQPGVSEIVLHSANLVLGTSIQQLLDPLPTFAGDQRLVSAQVCGRVPVEIAGVHAFSKDMMNQTAVELAPTQLETFRVALTPTSLGPNRVGAGAAHAGSDRDGAVRQRRVPRRDRR